MKLEGSLDAFGLADVCTLLASTGKSGALELAKARPSGGPVRGIVWFNDGQICGASADLSRQNLARRIIGSGAVDDIALRHAVARVVSGGIGVARALLESGSVDAVVVRQAAREQVTDAMSELLTWTVGDFAFNADHSDSDDVGVLIPVAEALRDAQDRQLRWSQFHSAISGHESVLALAPGVAADPTVSRDEWGVMALVDGHRTVQDLAELTGTGLYGVTSILTGLVQRGLLTVKDPTSPDHVSSLERRFAMLMSIEDLGAFSRPTVVQMTSPPVPGGLGLTAAAVMNATTSLEAEHSGGGRAQFTEGVRAYSGSGDISPSGESVLRGRDASGVSMSMSVSTPGGLGSAVIAARELSRDAPGFEGNVTRSQAATAPSTYAAELLKRDPAMNRTLLLRLIAGVRGL
ncbi:MAG: DUF4388 domain-containing protein [Actinomycetes bacterium]